MLNRTRVWLNCFNLDRSTGSQYGKPPIINPRDYTAAHSEDWWRSSPHNMKNFDIHICAYNADLKVMAGFIAKIYSDPHHPTGLNREVDFQAVATATDDELQVLYTKWMATIHANADMNDPQNSFRTGLLGLAYSYARLVALSYGFQHALGKDDGKYPLLSRVSPVTNNSVLELIFFFQCIKAASDVVNVVVHDICRPSQIHFWRYGPEAQSVFVTFAAAFLVKVKRSFTLTEICANLMVFSSCNQNLLHACPLKSGQIYASACSLSLTSLHHRQLPSMRNTYPNSTLDSSQNSWLNQWLSMITHHRQATRE